MSKNPKNWWKSLKIANIDREILDRIFKKIKDLRNFNEIFRKSVTYYNIKSHKKPGFHPLFRRCVFRKTTGEEGGGVKLNPPAVLWLTAFRGCCRGPSHASEKAEVNIVYHPSSSWPFTLPPPFTSLMIFLHFPFNFLCLNWRPGTGSSSGK